MKRVAITVLVTSMGVGLAGCEQVLEPTNEDGGQDISLSAIPAPNSLSVLMGP